jgi:hypothetical protein
MYGQQNIKIFKETLLRKLQKYISVSMQNVLVSMQADCIVLLSYFNQNWEVTTSIKYRNINTKYICLADFDCFHAYGRTDGRT